LRGRNKKLFFTFDDIWLEKTIYEIINRGMESLDESAQRDALSFVSMTLKSTIMPTARDLHLIWRYFNISFRCTDAILRQEALVSLGKFLLWIKTSSAAVVTRPKDFTPQDQESLRLCEAWIQGMCKLCLHNIHPDSSHGKKSTGIEALCLILDAFGEFLHSPEATVQGLRYNHSTDSSRKSPVLKSMSKGNEIGKGLKYGAFNPFPASLLQRSTCRLIFQSMFDPWERLRESISAILLMLPSPLPAFETAEEIQECLAYLFHKLCSPRMIDSDAAARLITVFFRKYVIDLGWCIRVRSKWSFVVDTASDDALNPFYFFCDVLDCAQLADDIRECHAEESHKHDEFAYGYLVVIQYVVPFLPFSDIKSSKLDALNPKIAVRKLGELLIRIYEQFMPILSVPEENYTELMESVPGSQHSLMDALDCKTRSEQLTLCASWMNSKAFCDILDTMWDLKRQGSNIPLSLEKDLLKWGNLVVSMLLEAKHYGTLDKAKHLFSTILNVAGSDRKFSERDYKHEISTLWMKIFLEHMKRPNQRRRDAVRRSGGIPFGIHCIISSNSGKMKPDSLLESTIRDLISIASGALPETDQYWPRIHAINTLRVTFADTKLTAIEVHCQEGT